jgi:hypothetical protein
MLKRVLNSEKNVWMANFDREAKRKRLELDQNVYKKAIQLCEQGLTSEQAVQTLLETMLP